MDKKSTRKKSSSKSTSPVKAAKKSTRKKSGSKPTSTKSTVELVKAIPEEKLIQVVRQVTKVETFSGPIPPPTVLEACEKYAPGATRLFLKVFAAEHDLHKYVTKKVLDNDNLRARGSILLGVLLILNIIPLAMLGYPWQGMMLGLAGTLSIIARQLAPRQRNK